MTRPHRKPTLETIHGPKRHPVAVSTRENALTPLTRFLYMLKHMISPLALSQLATMLP